MCPNPQLTDDAFGPTAIDAWLPEGAVRLAQDPGLGGGVVVVLEEVPLRAVVLQCLANRYDRVVIWKKQLRCYFGFINWQWSKFNSPLV